MSFSLSSLLNPEPATAAQASPDVNNNERKSSLGYEQQQQEQHYTYPPSTAVEAAEALATLAASEAPPPTQYYTSHAATSPLELPPPTPTTTARQPSSPTLEQYQTSSRSPEQQRRPSIISPALTLPPLQNLTSPPLEEQTQTPRVLHHQRQQPTPESAYISSTLHQQVPSAPMMQPRLPSQLDGTSSSPPPPTTSSPVTGRRSSVQPTELKTVAALKQEHSVSTQSPLRESSVPMPSTESAVPSGMQGVSNSDSANPVVKHKKTAPSKTKKGTASVSKRSAAGGNNNGPPSKKRKVEVKRSETPASRAVGKGSTTGGSSPVPSTQRSQSRSRSEEAERDEEEAYGSSGNDDGGSGEGDDSGDLYCICRKPDNGTFMIGCDGTCDDWYHGKCVGIEERDKNLIDKYLCPSCTKAGKGRTTWKRMCRREGCRLPAKVGKNKGGEGGSKYCSEECGVLFFREMVSRTRGREEVVKSRGGRRRGTGGSVGVGQEEDLVGARGGVLAAGEVKALLNVSKTAEDFKKLGEGVLSPPATPDGKDGLASSSVGGEGGVVFSEQDSAALAEVSKQKDAARKRHLVLKDRMKFVTMVKQAAGRMASERELKPKEFCGYDPRLEWTEEQFGVWRESGAGRQAFELETLAVEDSGNVNGVGEMEGVGEDVGGVYAMLDVCGRKKCARHLEWAKLAVDDLRFEMGDNGDRMRGLDREESEIREGAAMRGKGGMGGVGEGSVEVHGLGITGLNGVAEGKGVVSGGGDVEMSSVADGREQDFGSAALQVEEHEVVDEKTAAPPLEPEEMEVEQSAASVMAPEAMMVVDAAAS
ncbi:COMPASS (complex proteins associated with Set1p) component [Elasticomyces elasticus]|nr:COMPASS (complex proteins associated with Set1p) component [Elasticomyces elasticus]